MAEPGRAGGRRTLLRAEQPVRLSNCPTHSTKHKMAEITLPHPSEIISAIRTSSAAVTAQAKIEVSRAPSQPHTLHWQLGPHTLTTSILRLGPPADQLN